MSTTLPTADQIRQDWNTSPRWAGITRGYSAEEVVRCLVPDPAAGLWLSTAAYSWNT